MTGGRVLRLDVEYDGAGFRGWAHQPGLRTVEGVLRDALWRLVGHPVTLSVAGRTDAGVHALGQVVSVPVSSALPCGQILRALGALLPAEVAARAVADAPAGFDARRDALSRRYEYRLLLGPDSPLRRGRVHAVRRRLEVPAMAEAAGLLVGRHDFRAFTPARTGHVFFHRTVTECRFEQRDDELVLMIEANAFMRAMVRTVMGTLLDVGVGRRSPSSVGELLTGAPRSAAGPTAPPHGLCLVAVRYP